MMVMIVFIILSIYTESIEDGISLKHPYSPDVVFSEESETNEVIGVKTTENYKVDAITGTQIALLSIMMAALITCIIGLIVLCLCSW